MRPGVRAFYAGEAYDIFAAPDSLTVYAPTKCIRRRGETLNQPLLTIQFSSPVLDEKAIRGQSQGLAPSRFERTIELPPQVVPVFMLV